MRKEAKTRQPITYRGIQSYHAQTERGNYATQGFRGGFVFYASDRPIPANAKNKGFGLEIELSSRLNSRRALAFILAEGAFKPFPKGLFKQQSDASLEGNSTSEVITQPMSKAFIRNHYNDFHAMWDFMADMDTAPNDSCGMHTNVSMSVFGTTREKQEAAILRLHNWMSDNYRLACALFKRNENNTYYCSRMSRMSSLVPTGSHGTMMNYSHINEGDAARVEIRLVGPQKTFGAFRNTLETIFHLIEAAKDGRDMQDPVNLFKGCNECVFDRLNDIQAAGLITFEQLHTIAGYVVDADIRRTTR